MIYSGGEGGIRTHEPLSYQHFRPISNRSNPQNRSKPEYQVQNRYSEKQLAYDAFRAARRTACCRSQSACRCIHICGDVFRKRDSLSAVSAVMPRLPRTISLSRLSEIPRRRAASTCLIPSGLRYSSSRISPGGITGPSQFGSLVIVFDGNFVGMSVLPPEGDAVLSVHPECCGGPIGRPSTARGDCRLEPRDH